MMMHSLNSQSKVRLRDEDEQECTYYYALAWEQHSIQISMQHHHIIVPALYHLLTPTPSLHICTLHDPLSLRKGHGGLSCTLLLTSGWKIPCSDTCPLTPGTCPRGDQVLAQSFHPSTLIHHNSDP